MTAIIPPMSPSHTKLWRRPLRWLLPAALLAFMPKCLLCLAAYAGIGAALGFGGPEICGATSSNTMSVWAATLTLSGVALSAIGIIKFCAHHRRPNNTTSATPGK